MKGPRIGDALFAFLRQKDRLTEERPFGVTLLIAPFLVTTVLTIYTSFETSTRLFAVSHPFEHQTERSNGHDVWLSVGVKGTNLIIATIYGETFSWPLSGPDEKERATFEKFLQQEAEKLVTKATLKGQLTEGQNSVALSVDQRLTYQHIRPVLYALAAAGFSKYGFETRILKQ